VVVSHYLTIKLFFCRLVYDTVTDAIIIIGFCSSSSVFAISQVQLSEQFDQYKLAPYIEMLKDKDGKLSLEEVSSAEYNSEFIDVKGKSPNVGFLNSQKWQAYWVRFNIKSDYKKSHEVFLEYLYPHIDKIELYQLNNGNIVNYKLVGDKFKFAERELDFRNFVFKLKLPANSNTHIYLRMETDGLMRIPLMLWEKSSFIKKVNKEQTLYGIYFGIMIAMIVYNFFLWVYLRDKNYIYYVLYISFFLLVQFANTRMDAEYIYFNMPALANIFYPILWHLTLFFAVLFAKSFLDTKDKFPKINFVMNIFGLVSLIGIGLTIFLGYEVGLLPLVFITGIFLPPLLLFSGVYTWIKGQTTARYFVIAWLLLVISAIAFNLYNIGVLPDLDIIAHSTYIGSGFEVLFLSLALGHKMKIIEIEKLKAQAEALKYQTDFAYDLEIQVTERTKELELKNKIITEQNDKLEHIAMIDALTDIPNRRRFNEVICNEWFRALRSNSIISVAMVDIDHFKQYNDAFGHDVGDICLQKVAKTLNETMQRPGDFVARYGGEEFAVVLPHTNNEDALTLLEKMRIGVEELCIATAKHLKEEYITISIGTSTIVPGENNDYKQLVKEADKALYKAKNAGRNRVVTFQNSNHE